MEISWLVLSFGFHGVMVSQDRELIACLSAGQENHPEHHPEHHQQTSSGLRPRDGVCRASAIRYNQTVIWYAGERPPTILIIEDLEHQ